MKKVLLTGSEGIIGQVLLKGLKDWEITKFDSELGHDASDFNKLEQMSQGHDAIIHLAWNMTENWHTGKTHPHNLIMAQNVYEVALKNNIKRVIMASSVHVEDYRNDKPGPDSPYGQSKLQIEKMGESYAKKGLEVVCVRFGGVNPANTPEKDPIEAKIFLSHEDCVKIIQSLLEAPTIPNSYQIIYAISS